MPKTIVPFFNAETDIPVDYNIGLTAYKPQPKKRISGEEKTSQKADSWSFKQCFLSSLFIMNVFAFSVQLLRFNYLLSSYNSWLTELTVRVTPNATERIDQVSRYTNALGYMQFFEAFFFAPIVGTIIARVIQSRHITIITLLSLSYHFNLG